MPERRDAPAAAGNATAEPEGSNRENQQIEKNDTDPKERQRADKARRESRMPWRDLPDAEIEQVLLQFSEISRRLVDVERLIKDVEPKALSEQRRGRLLGMVEELGIEIRMVSPHPKHVYKPLKSPE